MTIIALKIKTFISHLGSKKSGSVFNLLYVDLLMIRVGSSIKCQGLVSKAKYYPLVDKIIFGKGHQVKKQTM